MADPGGHSAVQCKARMVRCHPLTRSCPSFQTVKLYELEPYEVNTVISPQNTRTFTVMKKRKKFGPFKWREILFTQSDAIYRDTRGPAQGQVWRLLQNK